MRIHQKGFTTPFVRKAALARDRSTTPKHEIVTDTRLPWILHKLLSVLRLGLDFAKDPAYAIPLLLNITGSVWFFVLIGEAGTGNVNAQLEDS